MENYNSHHYDVGSILALKTKYLSVVFIVNTKIYRRRIQCFLKNFIFKKKKRFRTNNEYEMKTFNFSQLKVYFNINLCDQKWNE